MVELPRILLVTRNLPPLLGGMERLNWHMVDELAKGAEVDVVAPADSRLPASDRAHLHGAPGRPLWRFLLSATWRSLRVARQRRPRIILAGSGLTAPIAWLAARGIGRGDRIGIRMPSGSFALYEAILAALATGAAYVPVDADDPDERADLVFSEANVVAVVTETGMTRGPGSSRGWRAGAPLTREVPHP